MSHAIYEDTITTQFADDFVQRVRSNSTGKNKIKQVKEKMKAESTNVNKWGILANPRKTTIVVYGCTIQSLRNIGGIKINLPLSNINNCNLRKLQIIQNRALRFSINYKLIDMIPSPTLHERGKIELINIKLYNQ